MVTPQRSPWQALLESAIVLPASVRVQSERTASSAASGTASNTAGVGTLTITFDADQLTSCQASSASTQRMVVTVVDETGTEVTSHSQPLTAAPAQDKRPLQKRRSNDARFEITVGGVALWHPRLRGAQPLYTVLVDVRNDRTDETLAESSVLTGFRSASQEDAIFAINGRRLFVRGTIVDVSDSDTQSTVAASIDLVIGANLNTIVLSNIVETSNASPHELWYRECDRRGILVGQKIGPSPKSSTAAAHAAATHPSVAFWALSTRSFRGRHQVAELTRLDPTRPALGGSLTATQCFGWGDTDERDLPDELRRSPKRARWVSGFGAPSAPVDGPSAEAMQSGSRWTRLADDDLTANGACFATHIPPAQFETYEAWSQATRNYQAMVTRFAVETVRRLKYEPSGGFIYSLFSNDSTRTEGPTSALVGPGSVPKEAYTAMQSACEPIQAICERLPSHLHGGEALALDVHVLNDTDEAVVDASVEATLTWADGEQSYRFSGDTDADSVRRAGTIQVVIPEVSGPLELQVTLHRGDVSTIRNYRSDIYADPHEH